MTKKILFVAPESVRWLRNGTKTTAFIYDKHEGEREVVVGNWPARVLRRTRILRALPIPVAIRSSSLLSQKTGLRVNVTPLKRIATYAITSHWHTEGEFKSPKTFDWWLEKYGYCRKVNKKGWLHKLEVIEDGA